MWRIDTAGSEVSCQGGGVRLKAEDELPEAFVIQLATAIVVEPVVTIRATRLGQRDYLAIDGSQRQEVLVGPEAVRLFGNRKDPLKEATRVGGARGVVEVVER